MFDFTPENATEFLKLLSPILPIFATYLVNKVEWPKVAKFGVAALAVVIMAVLQSYAEGKLEENFFSNLTTIFTVSQGIYWTVFKGFGLETFISPKESLAGLAAHDVSKAIADIPTQVAKDVLDNNTDSRLVTDVSVDGTQLPSQ